MTTPGMFGEGRERVIFFSLSSATVAVREWGCEPIADMSKPSTFAATFDAERFRFR
jgi:hypothetical protein